MFKVAVEVNPYFFSFSVTIYRSFKQKKVVLVAFSEETWTKQINDNTNGLGTKRFSERKKNINEEHLIKASRVLISQGRTLCKKLKVRFKLVDPCKWGGWNSTDSMPLITEGQGTWRTNT